MEMVIRMMELINRMSAAGATPTEVSATTELVTALVKKNAKQEERDKRRDEPWLVEDEAVLDMIDALMQAAEARGMDKTKAEFLTNLLVGQRYDPMSAMVSLYRLFEPDQLEWWDTVCQTYPDTTARVRAHNLRLAKKAKENLSLCPIIGSIEPAISRLTIPLLPFEAENHLTQARSYNQDLTRACLMVATEVVREHRMQHRPRSAVEGAGLRAPHVQRPHAQAEGAGLRAPHVQRPHAQGPVARADTCRAGGGRAAPVDGEPSRR
jgi:hypothetical protein